LGKRPWSARQRKAGAHKVIERLADDLRHEFSDMLGLSRANLFYMRVFAEAYPEEQIVQQLAGQIPWWHNVVTIASLKDPKLREWYIRAYIENGGAGRCFPIA
jgi:predicted nuclease of restriction endonuclease-like (RecB) superfamily